MITIYASIGNSDDKLPQARWSTFTRRFHNEINQYAHRLHGVWYSAPDSAFQNMCVGFEADEETALFLRKTLAVLCGVFDQDSIAWAVADTQFIRPADWDEAVAP